MSSDRPDDFDDVPVLQPQPAELEAALRDDYREPSRRPDWLPKRKPGFGVWLAIAWTLLYFVVTQVVAGIGFGILIFGIALVPEIKQNGWGVVQDPAKLTAWMQGPEGRVATLWLVAATQFTGLALSLLLLRLWCGKSWKRKIALTRLPTGTHALLIAIGIPALLAAGAMVEIPIERYVPSSQDVLNALGVDFKFEGAEMLPALIKDSPWALAIFVVAVSPGICEEFFCRGFLGQGLCGRYSTWIAVLITSFLFGCLHVDIRQGLGAMFLGAAIHAAYLATRSLWVAMLVHFANNGTAVVHFNAHLIPVLKPFEDALNNSPILFMASGVLLFAAVAYALYQTRCKLVPAVPGMPVWEPGGKGGVELPPPASGTIVRHDPISPASVFAVLSGAIAFGLVLAFG